MGLQPGPWEGDPLLLLQAVLLGLEPPSDIILSFLPGKAHRREAAIDGVGGERGSGRAGGAWRRQKSEEEERQAPNALKGEGEGRNPLFGDPPSKTGVGGVDGEGGHDATMAEQDPSGGEDAGGIGSPQAMQDALKGGGEGRTPPLETVLGGQSKTGVVGVDGEGGGGDDATMAEQDPSDGAEDAARCRGCGIDGIQDAVTVSGTQAGPSDVARSSSSPPAPESPGSYEEYECRICYHLYDLDGRTPRMLECLHTFCLQCLRRLHPALEEANSIRCPLCRHPTALPDGSALSLPLNTKRIQAILLQLHGWAPLLQPEPRRLLCAPTGQPKPPRRRPPTAPASPSSPDWRRKAGWVCALFSGLALLLLGLAWMEWLTGSVFLGVALALLFFSTMPFVMYRIRFRSQPGTVFLPSIAAGGGSREASPGRLTPRSRPRPALDGRTLSS